jgi:hypothetical protein
MISKHPNSHDLSGRCERIQRADEAGAHHKVIDWLTANEGNLVVDAIVVGELCVGILALPGGRKRTQPEQWFRDVVQTIDCLPSDANDQPTVS